MPKPTTKAEFNKFIRGYITEASPLNFPADASLDEENFELNRNGSRARRNGIGYEQGYVFRNLSISNTELASVIPTTYKWTNINGDATVNFIVVQAGRTLYFHDMSQASLSSTGLVGQIVLDSFPVDVKYSITSVDGTLIVVAGNYRICVVEYTNSVFTATYKSLEVRDVWGIEVT